MALRNRYISQESLQALLTYKEIQKLNDWHADRHNIYKVKLGPASAGPESVYLFVPHARTRVKIEKHLSEQKQYKDLQIMRTLESLEAQSDVGIKSSGGLRILDTQALLQ